MVLPRRFPAEEGHVRIAAGFLVIFDLGQALRQLDGAIDLAMLHAAPAVRAWRLDQKLVVDVDPASIGAGGAKGINSGPVDVEPGLVDAHVLIAGTEEIMPLGNVADERSALQFAGSHHGQKLGQSFGKLRFGFAINSQQDAVRGVPRPIGRDRVGRC